MHLVEKMAYVGDRPWHGLGNRLEPDQSIDVWKQNAGMDWTIEESEVRFITGQNSIGMISAFPAQKVLYRSDTKAPLSVVSKRFQVVQLLQFWSFIVISRRLAASSWKRPACCVKAGNSGPWQRPARARC